jgi:heme ABC exporter ATP-binding subunit CcmA
VNPDAPAVALSGLTHSYGGPPVLAGIDLEIGAGRVIAVHGPNGAGKTTLLRLLATRLRPTRGEARVFGFDVVRQAHEVRELVAVLPVYGGAYGALSGRENLQLAVKLRQNKPLQHADTAIDQALAQVGLGNAAQHLVRAYSSGMRKRLALARLLLADARVWLLDEPYAALDEAGQALVDGLIAQAKREARTVLVASHDLPRSLQTADAVIEVNAGSVRVLARPERGHGNGAAKSSDTNTGDA